MKGIVMTPRYAYCRDRNGCNDKFSIRRVDTDEELAAIAFWDEPDTTEAAEAEAKAELIVNALNRHEQATHALQRLLDAFSRIPITYLDRPMYDALHEAGKALSTISTTKGIE